MVVGRVCIGEGRRANLLHEKRIKTHIGNTARGEKILNTDIFSIRARRTLLTSTRQIPANIDKEKALVLRDEEDSRVGGREGAIND